MQGALRPAEFLVRRDARILNSSRGGTQRVNGAANRAVADQTRRGGAGRTVGTGGGNSRARTASSMRSRIPLSRRPS